MNAAGFIGEVIGFKSFSWKTQRNFRKTFDMVKYDKLYSMKKRIKAFAEIRNNN